MTAVDVDVNVDQLGHLDWQPACEKASCDRPAAIVRVVTCCHDTFLYCTPCADDEAAYIRLHVRACHAEVTDDVLYAEHGFQPGIPAWDASTCRHTGSGAT